MPALRSVVVIGAALACLTTPARAQDRKKAAEHFALAEQAEKREDWRAAIQQYELAYAASPHPAVLYNIARNYEKLGNARSAAEYFTRYLNEAGDASDRPRVEARIATLRDRPSTVDVTARPAGAVVFVDGEERGAAPTSFEVAAGEHTAYVAYRGRTSQPRQFRAAFGEAVPLEFDLTVDNGLLVVRSNVDGAEVRIDGDLAGHTPFSGPVPAGERQVVVTREGYRAAQRTVTVPANGSQQIRTELERIPGADTGETETPRTARWLFGLAYGYDALFEAGRFGLNLGVRTPGERLEASLLFGVFGNARTALGLEARYYFRTEGLRPYIRGAAMVLGDGESSMSDRMVAAEATVGALLATRPSAYRIEYYLEVGLHAIAAGLESGPDGEEPSRYGIPIMLGVQWSLGGSE